MSAPKARLCISCEVDRPGIVAAVSGFLHNHGANITHLDQHSTDPEGGHFYMPKDLNPANFIDFNRMLLALIGTDSPARHTVC